MHLHWKLLKILWTYLQHTNTIRWPKIRLELRKKKKKSGPSNSRENIQETEAIQPLLSRWRLPSNCLNQHVGLSTKFTKAEKSKSEGSKQFQTKLNVYKKSLALFKLFFFIFKLICQNHYTSQQCNLNLVLSWLTVLCVTTELYTTRRHFNLSGLHWVSVSATNLNKIPGLKVMMAESGMMISTADWAVPPPSFICWSPNLWCDGIRSWNLWEIIGARRGHENRTLVWWDGCPWKKRHQQAFSASPWSLIHVRIKGHVSPGGEDICL